MMPLQFGEGSFSLGGGKGWSARRLGQIACFCDQVRVTGTAIPRYHLYGERDDDVADRFVHIETIACRSGANNWTILPHAHAALDHLFVVTGGGGEMRVDGRSIAFGEAILIVPAGAVHGFRFDPETVGHVVTIAEPLMRTLADGQEPIARLRSEARAVPIGDPEELVPVLAGLAMETESTAPLAPMAGEALLRMLVIAAARRLPTMEAAAASVPRRSMLLVARYRGQIDRQLRSGWTVADHATALGISVSRLRAACGEVAGVAPIRILHERLLAETRRQLSYTDRSIAEIAYDLGFDDPAYFNRFFRRSVGMAPGSWRAAQVSGDLASGEPRAS
jgi:AraC family transcriptional activator of pobA